MIIEICHGDDPAAAVGRFAISSGLEPTGVAAAAVIAAALPEFVPEDPRAEGMRQGDTVAVMVAFLGAGAVGKINGSFDRTTGRFPVTVRGREFKFKPNNPDRSLPCLSTTRRATFSARMAASRARTLTGAGQTISSRWEQPSGQANGGTISKR
jgi:hypothetical protein